MPIEQFKQLYQRNEQQIVERYFDYLRFPSVSSEAEHTADVRACAEWLERYLKESGFEAEIWETSGHPTVFGEWLNAGADKPTVLIYGHYDVQPVDPLDAWLSPPFSPEVREGKVYARGAQDNKGQSMYSLAAVRALLAETGRLPVNVKVVLEGDEERGSGGLLAIIEPKAEKLRADHVIIGDLGFNSLERPSLTLGLRGIVTMTVRVRGSRTDLHSGMVGGMAYNPNRALAEMLARLHDERGRVTVPGFYDAVRNLSSEDREALDFTFNAGEYEKNFGGKPTGGEIDYSELERVWIRPTLEINGMAGGYFGSGFKTVIPAESIAKISCRLVPDQDPQDIAYRTAQYIRSLAPDGIEVEVEPGHGGSSAVRTSRTTPIVSVASQAMEEVLGRKCSFMMEGGSIHVVEVISKAARGEPVLFGFGLPTDQIHAPNEHFGLDRLQYGFVTVCRMLELLAQWSK